MRIRWTLTRELVLLTLIQVGVLIFVYSQLLPYYLWNGIEQAAQVFLQSEAESAANLLARDGVLPASAAPGVQLYAGTDDIPERIRNAMQRRGDLPVGRLVTRSRGGAGLMMFAVELDSQRRVYAIFEANEAVLGRPGGPVERMFSLLELRDRVGIAFVLVWVVLTGFLLRRIYVRTQRMTHWTRALSNPGPKAQPPKFGYGEFDDVGRELSDAFERVSSALERERDFVRNASHELRTPIAIVQSNLDLERKRTGNEAEPLQRVRRATHRMQKLVETLLWLSREQVESMVAEPVNLRAMVDQLVSEHAYLLQGGEVRVRSPRIEPTPTVAAQPLQIILANLIRNAFEHGGAEDVEIDIDDSSVRVRNLRSDTEAQDVVDGLGLTLVQKIADRMQWRVERASQAGAFEVCVWLSEASDSSR
ncbi:MAG: HAMP domain-containing sensor histidine kinase [Pseudomonadota bacterium]